jgi:hypothetical protein
VEGDELLSSVAMQFVTRILDKVFTCLNLRAQEGLFFLQVFICFINLVFSIYPIIMYFVYSNNIHVMFWMGNAPQYANLTVPMSLCFLNVGVNIVSNLKLETKRAQKVCFFLFCMLGCINMSAGLWVFLEARRVSEDLIDECGSTTLTARIEAEWQRLSAFYQTCQVTAGKMIYIQECPGFAQVFPNRVYVNYIEDVEIDYNCVGFCQFWAQPIFNMDSDRGLRCATALGLEMKSVGNIIGLPTACIGAIIVTWGICLAMYDHL